MRRLWILSSGAWSNVQLGPSQRLAAIANLALERGFEPHLALDTWSAPPPDGVHAEPQNPASVERIAPADATLVSPFVSQATLRALLRRRIPFLTDFYCVGALEALGTTNPLPAWRLHQGRVRNALRHLFLARGAEHSFFSTDGQRTFVAGTLYALGSPSAAKLAAELPSRSSLMPMGIPDAPFPAGHPFPYPDCLRGRRIFLWGGGLWSWMDWDTPIRAFASRQGEPDPPVLFFLAGRNESGLSVQDTPLEQARELARSLGALGTTVYFNERRAGPGELPGYLEHCHAGILSNPPQTESLASWRTRLLDLLWAGRPLVSSGWDPLGAAMAQAGAARIAPHSDPIALARALDAFRTPDAWSAASDASARLGSSMRWSQALAPLARRMDHGSEFCRTVGERPGTLEKLRYIAGA